MRVQDGVHARVRLVDPAVQMPLQVERPRLGPDRAAIEGELHDVAGVDDAGTARAREQVAVRMGGMAYADMAEGIENALVRQNAIGDDQILDDAFETHLPSLLNDDLGHDAGWKDLLRRDVLVRNALLESIEEHLLERRAVGV